MSHIARARSRARAAVVGLAVDAVIGDPGDTRHPVRWLGRAASALEQITYRDHRINGAVHLGSVAAGAALLVGRSDIALGGAVAVSSAGRTLSDRALRIAELVTAGRLDEARAMLPWLVGRDPADLGASDICRAVVESVAENSTDAVVAPIWWAVAGGPRAVAVHRAVNTLDAMIGYRNDRYERFGWAAARTDDALAWWPARLTAATVALVRPTRAPDVWRVVRRDAPGHPSPNAGVVEAAWAAALDVRLGGPVRYNGRSDQRPWLGDGTPDVGPADVVAAVGLLRDVRIALAAALMVGSSWPAAPRTRP